MRIADIARHAVAIAILGPEGHGEAAPTAAKNPLAALGRLLVARFMTIPCVAPPDH
ncbi:MAG: hypothetical protein KC729_13940 [Candidatus Eisenbacteria bacterium]|uniref:Uncharacterized protein n=1 Tax=Eiseniibacteriota bacterium TaxID=2212470 RepID=A0A956RQS6_UNCEI|nr:hypothetical protein [Candidatus Eisenbacteria bacterium]